MEKNYNSFLLFGLLFWHLHRPCAINVNLCKGLNRENETEIGYAILYAIITVVIKDN